MLPSASNRSSLSDNLGESDRKSCSCTFQFFSILIVLCSQQNDSFKTLFAFVFHQRSPFSLCVRWRAALAVSAHANYTTRSLALVGTVNLSQQVCIYPDTHQAVLHTGHVTVGEETPCESEQAPLAARLSGEPLGAQRLLVPQDAA